MRKIVNDTFDEVFGRDTEGVISEVDLEDIITQRVNPQNMTELRVMDRYMYFRFFSRFMDDSELVEEQDGNF